MMRFCEKTQKHKLIKTQKQSCEKTQKHKITNVKKHNCEKIIANTKKKKNTLKKLVF